MTVIFVFHWLVMSKESSEEIAYIRMQSTILHSCLKIFSTLYILEAIKFLGIYRDEPYIGEKKQRKRERDDNAANQFLYEKLHQQIVFLFQFGRMQFVDWFYRRLPQDKQNTSKANTAFFSVVLSAAADKNRTNLRVTAKLTNVQDGTRVSLKWSIIWG